MNHETPVAVRAAELAKRLNVSSRTLANWLKSGLIPHVRVGRGRRRVLLFPVEAVRDWLAQQAAHSTPPAEST